MAQCHAHVLQGAALCVRVVYAGRTDGRHGTRTAQTDGTARGRTARHADGTVTAIATGMPGARHDACNRNKHAGNVVHVLARTLQR